MSKMLGIKSTRGGGGAFGIADGSGFRNGVCYSLRSVRGLGMGARVSVIKMARRLQRVRGLVYDV